MSKADIRSESRKISGSQARILKSASRLLQELTHEDIALLSGGERTEYTKRGKGKTLIHSKPLKKKGGHASADFTAAEIHADLRTEMSKAWPDPRIVTPLTLKLRSMLNW
ncbi:MAG: hypothetical protein QQN63_00840 [Nitrosopumilus sp.]